MNIFLSNTLVNTKRHCPFSYPLAYFLCFHPSDSHLSFFFSFAQRVSAHPPSLQLQCPYSTFILCFFGFSAFFPSICTPISALYPCYPFCLLLLPGKPSVSRQRSQSTLTNTYFNLNLIDLGYTAFASAFFYKGISSYILQDVQISLSIHLEQMIYRYVNKI